MYIEILYIHYMKTFEVFQVSYCKKLNISRLANRNLYPWKFHSAINAQAVGENGFFSPIFRKRWKRHTRWPLKGTFAVFRENSIGNHPHSTRTLAKEKITRKPIFIPKWLDRPRAKNRIGVKLMQTSRHFSKTMQLLKVLTNDNPPWLLS